MRYAINISDLATFQDEATTLYNHMVLPKLTEKVVSCEEGLDGDGLLLVPLPERQACAIIDILHNGIGRYKGTHRNHLRIYQQKEGSATWRRV